MKTAFRFRLRLRRLRFAYGLVKTRLSESDRSRRTKPTTKRGNVHSDWLILSLLLPTPTIWFSLDHKQNVMHLSMLIPWGGGGECGQGEGIWCLWLFPCRAFDRAKRPRGRDIWLWPIEAWYQFRSGYQVCPSRLSESHAVGERYEVFICFNHHNPIL